MKNHSSPSSFRVFTILGVFACLVLTALSDPATGWKQTGAGPYNYNDAANWVDGDINGVFGSDLTLTANQTITFAANTTLANGLNIAYKGNYAMTFQSDGNGSKTLTLGGDITCNVAANGNAAHVTLGSDTAANNLAIDLGGAQRTFASVGTQNDPNKSGWVKLYAPMSNGAVTYSGIGCFKLYAANTYTGDTTLSNTGYIYMNDAGCFSSGAVTIADCGGSAWPRLHCDAADITIANDFTILGDFGFHGGKPTSLTGTLTIPAPVRFWCESDNLTINSPTITDGNSGCAIGNLYKWGSKTVNVYTPIVVNGTTITMGNGTWNQRGAISGTSFTLGGATGGGNAFFHCHSAANSFTGNITVNGDPNFVYLSFQTAGALPDDVTILLLNRGQIQGVQSAGYACGTLLANGRIDPASTGGLSVVNNENVDIDLTDYPNLSIGTAGNANYYGHLTPANGVYRFCSASHVYLGAENALTGKADVLVEMPSAGTSLYLDKRNDVEGTVTVVNCGLVLRTDAGSLPNAQIHMHGGNLHLNPASDAGTRRAEYIHLHGSTLTLNGNSKNVTSDIIGELILDVRDPAYGVIGGVNHINLNANGKAAALHIEQFTRTNNAIWRLGGKYDNNNNRLRIGGADGENTVQFTVGNSAEILGQLVGGGGAAGTTTISVYPFAFANVGTYYDSLLTYGSTGFRALDYETEFATTITPGTVSQNNVRLPVGSTTEITSDTTVNAVFLQGSEPNKGNTSLTGNGTLTVSSGVLVMGYHRSAKPIVNCAAVNFGNHPGVIGFARGKGSDWNAALKGSAGAILWQFADSAGTGSGGTGVTISGANIAASTLTGDVVMHGNVVGNANGAFPGGATRPGNLYVNAYCNLLDGDGFNGVYGIGNLQRNNDTIVMGADGSNGDFDGYLSNATTLIKNGAGRQRLGGSSTHTKPTTVNAGALQVDGAITASAVTVASGATLGGVGSFGKAVTVADGAALEAGSAQIDYADDHSLDFEDTLALSGDATLRVKVYAKDALATVTAAAVTGSGTVTVAMNSGDYSGTFLVLKSDAALPCTFAKGANCGGLKLLNNDTELWVTHVPETIILVQ